MTTVEQYLFFPTNKISCCSYSKGSFLRVPNTENVRPNPRDFPYTMPTDAVLKSLFLDMSSYSSATATLFILRNGVRVNTGITATTSETTDGIDFRSSVKTQMEYPVEQGDMIGVFVVIPEMKGEEYPFVAIGFVPTV